MEKIFYINSRNRLDGTDSDFTYKLDMSGLNCSHAVILAAYIPKSYYSIDGKSTTFILEEDKKQSNVVIPSGSYGRQALKTTLQTALNIASPNGWSYSISSPSTSTGETGKLTFSITGNEGIQPFFIFSNLGPWEQLGFNRNSKNIFLEDVLESKNVINLQGENTLFLHSDIVQSSDNIIQEFYSTTKLSFGSIVFQNPNVVHYAKPLQNKSDNVYRFYLTDEDSNPIYLNGLNIVFTLKVFRPLDLRMALTEIINIIS